MRRASKNFSKLFVVLKSLAKLPVLQAKSKKHWLCIYIARKPDHTADFAYFNLFAS